MYSPSLDEPAYELVAKQVKASSQSQTATFSSLEFRVGLTKHGLSHISPKSPPPPVGESCSHAYEIHRADRLAVHRPLGVLGLPLAWS
jgi:hypothetical protein